MSKTAKSTVNVYRKKPVMKSRIIPTLHPDGSEKLDPKPLAADLVGFRPLTLEEQYNRFTAHGDRVHNLVYDDHLVDDDFEDYVDDDSNGLTPHEVSDLQKQLAKVPKSKLADTLHKLLSPEKRPKKAAKKPAAPAATPPAPTPEQHPEEQNSG